MKEEKSTEVGFWGKPSDSNLSVPGEKGRGEGVEKQLKVMHSLRGCVLATRLLEIFSIRVERLRFSSFG